ncbi:hepcidin-2-like [Pelodytes ibericus]
MRSLSLGLLLLLSVLFHRSHPASLEKNEITKGADQISEPQMEESNILEPLLRTKRHSHLSFCIYCCNCCKNKGCGMCCKT